ncbi:MAG: calcineurin-like phosphoesterase family protein [bacterium]|nr:calcineurin-like phosphoesterase family protein [bacterium]
MEKFLYRVRCLVFICSLLVVGILFAKSEQAQLFAVGFVYHDANRNQIYDPGEKGIPNIRVSNGRDIVLTDVQGRYRIPIEADMILFVIKPTGWTTAFDADNFPKFYYIYKPYGSPSTRFAGSTPTGALPESIDFPLYPQDEPSNFKVLFFGDIQVRNRKTIEYFARSVVEELIDTDAKFGVTLGDNVSDILDLYPELKSVIGYIGIPIYFTFGNHDSNYDVTTEKYTHETYSRYFGPVYYSFEYGKVHFIVLENIAWSYDSQRQKLAPYTSGLGRDQLEFIKNDLALVPKDYLIVLAMHIPIMDIREKGSLFRLLEQFPYTFSISGHEHTMEHRFLTRADGWFGVEPHHHYIAGAVCGNWWYGMPDEYGIPHSMMSDGTPSGYAIITFTGNKYSIEYKVAQKPNSFQMHLYAPDEITIDQITTTGIIVNIFAGSAKSKVEIKFGKKGSWFPMEKVSLPDPYYTKQFELITEKPNWIPNAILCPHIWRASIPASLGKGSHLIQVRTTDMFGHVYTAYRVITIQ